MKRAFLMAAMAIPILYNVQDKWFFWIAFGLGSVFVLKKRSYIFIGLTLCIFGQWSILDHFPILFENRIVELNNQSFVVATSLGKVLVYTKNSDHFNLLDEIILAETTSFSISPTTYGFDQSLYTTLNGLIASSNESEVKVHRPNALMNFIGLGGFNSNPAFNILSRALMFQSDPLMSFNAVISMGLIYILIYQLGRYLLSLIFNETISAILMLAVMIFGAIVFTYPLTLIRVIISVILVLVFKDKRNRLVVFVLFFVFYQSSSFQSAAILYPLLFMFISSFELDKAMRWSNLSFLQFHLFHRVSIGLVVLYPILRKMLTCLYVLIWLGYLMPFLTPLILMVAQMNQTFYKVLENLGVLHGRINPLIGIILCCGFVLLGFFKLRLKVLVIIFALSIPLLSSPWFYQISFISVGQGDAILLQAPFNQEVILIDTGKINAYGQLSSFLNAQGITRIDRLVLTHADADHNGNWASLLKDYQVGQLITEAQTLKLKWFNLKSLKVPMSNPNDNQASLIYALNINSMRFLFMADVDEITEIELLKQYPDLKADVLKIAHHGSAGSSSDFFLSHVQAKLAIISVGNNAYGHPSIETLNRLTKYHIPMMMTKTEGDISFILNEYISGLWTSSRKLKQLRLGF